MIRWLSLLMLVSVTTGLASAQPRLGDFLVTEGNANYVAYVDRSSGIMTTLAALPGKPLPLMMAANNTDVLVFELNQPSWSIWNVTPAGVVTTVGQGSRTGEGNQTGCDWMQDGHILVCTSAFSTRGWLRSMDLSTNTYTTLYTAPISHFRHAAVNTDNGNALICRWAAFGDLFERDLTAQTLTTIISGLDRANNVDPEPATGNFVVSSEWVNGKVQVITPGGQVVTTINLPYARGVKVEDSTGHYVVATDSPSSSPSSVVEFDTNGSAVRTYGPFGTASFAGIEIYGSRQVHGSGPAAPGSAYNVNISFPGAGPIPYLAALSFGQRPGFRFGGRTVNLALDALFFATVQGLFVSNFQGLLDSSGRASGTINIPSFVPRGVRFYCSAIATNGLVFLTGNTIGVTVQ